MADEFRETAARYRIQISVALQRSVAMRTP
jgi:hypothetical protein